MGLLDTILRLALLPKVKKSMKDAEKKVENDPELQKSIESYSHHYKELQKNLGSFCKRNPDSSLCGGESKATVKRVK